jgi:tRNA (uracil-5-)-methyltransferase
MRQPRHRKKFKNVYDDLSKPYIGSAEPECPHFGHCGGCAFQDIRYDLQLEMKKKYLLSLFAGNERIVPCIESLEVKGSSPYEYRNRMDFVCAFGKRGLRERGRYREVVDIADCRLMNGRMNMIWKQARSASEQVEDYNYLDHTGFLRYIVIRGAGITGETMVNCVLSREGNEIEPVLRSITPLVESMSLIIHDGLADLSGGRILEDVKRGYIEETFDGITYRITPNSFFQSNSLCARDIYRRIAQEARGRTLDLFSGVGSISLFVAKHVDSIIGVELIEEAVASARDSAARNGIDNATFISADALAYMRENHGIYDTLILDPPRTGAHPKVMKMISECAPERIIYMSCNPSTFRENIALLTGYRLISFEAFDMFPQTPHMETLAVFERSS